MLLKKSKGKTKNIYKQMKRKRQQLKTYAAKAVIREKFIAIQSYLKKQEKHRIDNVTLHLKQLEKEQKSPKLVEGKTS